jgi:hypothetical protein
VRRRLLNGSLRGHRFAQQQRLNIDLFALLAKLSKLATHNPE